MKCEHTHVLREVVRAARKGSGTNRWLMARMYMQVQQVVWDQVGVRCGWVIKR